MSEQTTAAGSMIDVGWGRLIFAHTFPDPASVAQALLEEEPDRRDIAFYVNDPQLILNEAPQDLFLDPSSTFRRDLKTWCIAPDDDLPFQVSEVASPVEFEQINRIYLSQGMVPVDGDLLWRSRDDKRFHYFVAKANESGDILGVVLAVDHTRCFDDLFNSSSLWALAVDPQTEYPRVGATLVKHVLDTMASRGRDLLDLSVLQDNEVAVKLYESIGFERVPVLAIKRRNQINEPLFIPQHTQEGYNPYATIIINEALRRSIAVEPIDPERGYFRLVMGNRRITCRESLSDMTSAIAMCRCADKRLTREILQSAGLSTPDQLVYESPEQARQFLARHGRIVVKPADGEQGHGVGVDLREWSDVETAIQAAREWDETVLLEEFVQGQDLRIIVINMEVVAAAVRKPPEIVGFGDKTARDLLERVSRRRRAATDGESEIPLDQETERCLRDAGHGLDDVIPDGETIQVRRTANLHTGGTIHDVTDQLSSTLEQAAVAAARALEIPVVGFDFLTPDVAGDEYVIIEANERPGLANHEPAPTAERFIDLLFPQTARLTNPA